MKMGEIMVKLESLDTLVGSAVWQYITGSALFAPIYYWGMVWDYYS